MDEDAGGAGPVYGNRRRVRGGRGQRLLRQRGEYVERSFAHVYDTGGMRRTHLRGHRNILKRLLVHASAFNLGLLMRQACGRGTPRGLQGRRFALGALEMALAIVDARIWTAAMRTIVQTELMQQIVSTYFGRMAPLRLVKIPASTAGHARFLADAVRRARSSSLRRAHVLRLEGVGGGAGRRPVASDGSPELAAADERAGEAFRAIWREHRDMAPETISCGLFLEALDPAPPAALDVPALERVAAAYQEPALAHRPGRSRPAPSRPCVELRARGLRLGLISNTGRTLGARSQAAARGPADLLPALLDGLRLLQTRRGSASPRPRSSGECWTRRGSIPGARSTWATTR